MEPINYIKTQADILRSREKADEREMKSYPDGDVHCYKNKNGFMTRISVQGKSDIYLPKSEQKLAEVLARKALCQARLKDTKTELYACEQYLKVMNQHPHAVEKLMARPGMNQLIGVQTEAWNEYAKNWMTEPYEKLESYAEGKTVPTVAGINVRSKSESMCVQLLCELHIPFRYEQKWAMKGGDMYPDFTVMRQGDHAICLIELFGRMGDPKYMDRTYDKLRVYGHNGWIPDQNLFCFFESDQAPLDVWHVRKTMVHFLQGK